MDCACRTTRNTRALRRFQSPRCDGELQKVSLEVIGEIGFRRRIEKDAAELFTGAQDFAPPRQIPSGIRRGEVEQLEGAAEGIVESIGLSLRVSADCPFDLAAHVSELFDQGERVPPARRQRRVNWFARQRSIRRSRTTARWMVGRHFCKLACGPAGWRTLHLGSADDSRSHSMLGRSRAAAKRPFKLVAINAGNTLASLLIMGAILA